MPGVIRWPSSLKGRVGRRYRRAQRLFEDAVLERGLQSTWVPDVSSGYLFVARGLWGCRVGRQDAFLDYGSGKGRALLAAARYPFGRVIGVELNEWDCEIARSNATIAAPRLRCSQIEVVTADATVWPVPDDVTYVYMFNPFWGETFRMMLDRLLESAGSAAAPADDHLRVSEVRAGAAGHGALHAGQDEPWAAPAHPAAADRGVPRDRPQHRSDGQGSGAPGPLSSAPPRLAQVLAQEAGDEARVVAGIASPQAPWLA